MDKGEFETAPLAGWWPGLTFQCERRPSDLFAFGPRWFVSDRFRRLCDGFQVNAEFLPVDIVRPNGAPASDVPYWYLHVLDRIDCVDYAASDYDNIYGDKHDFHIRTRGLRRLVMRPEAIGNRDLFKADRLSGLYVSQKLRDASLGAGLKVPFGQLPGDQTEPMIADVRAQETADVRAQETIVVDAYKEIELGTDVLGEFEDYAAEGVTMLGLTHSSTPYDTVKEVNAFIDRWQAERRDKSINDDPDEVGSTALSLGIVWGNAVCKEFGWQWTCVEHKGNTFYIVASPDRSYACYPTYDVRALLNDPRGDNCAALLFNMMKAGKYPPSQPRRYLSIRFGR